MRFIRCLAWLGVSAVLLSWGCGSDESGGGGQGGAGGALPPEICLAPGAGPYGALFSDQTEALGLGPTGLNVAANNLTITDIDGDHWPDISTQKAAAAPGRDNPATPAGSYRLLRNTAGIGFEDRTWTSGLYTARDGNQGRAVSFVMWGDVDNDGDADAFVATYRDADNLSDMLDSSSVYLNDGSGLFTIGPDQAFSPVPRDPVAGAAFLDYDRNGLLDLWIGHHYGRYGYLESSVQDSLFAGDGAGFFNDVTTPAGLETVTFAESAVANGNTHKPTWGVTACDVDGDGWTDLMTCSYGRQLNAFYRNRGDGSFEDLTLTSGLAHDANEDYSDNQFYRCFCESHPTNPACAGAEPASIVCDGLENAWSVGSDDQPWRLGGNNSNAVCGDVDNDGDMDVMLVELAHWHIGRSSDKTELLLNDGFPEQPLVRPGAAATGIDRTRSGSWNDGDLGGALADFDNDGRLDALVASSDYPGTYSLLYQQQADGRYLEIGETAGVHVARAHGLGIVDYDRDGDYDIVLGRSLARWAASDSPPPPADAYVTVLRNEAGQNANKLLLHLEGAGGAGGANRDAVGARITVRAGGRTLMREVQGGYGLSGIEPDRLVIIGLGTACQAEQLVVRWPNAAGDELTLTNVLANYVLVVREGQEVEYQTLAQYTGTEALD